MRHITLLYLFLFSFFSVLAQEKTPLSNIINSSKNEYLPVITTDGETLYFCSDNRKDSSGIENIYVSHFLNNRWLEPELLTELSTDTTNDAVLSVSADGNSLLIFSNGKIFESKKNKDGWSKKKKIDALDFGSWNADAFYTADGNNILFTSVSLQNIGGSGDFFYSNTDIYVISKKDDNSWTEPKNLGATINTAKQERTPFLHPDMKTLYFSSELDDGFGGIDVYKSTRIYDTSWTHWTKPINLGENINTNSYDYCFKISTDGTKAIFNTLTNIGDQDIYEIFLEKENRPEQVVSISGTVTDKQNNPLDAQIVWENLETGEKIGSLTSSPTNGKYIITLPMGKNYGFYVSKENYYSLSDNINLKNKPKSMNISKNFILLSELQILKGDVVISLKNIFFETNKYELQKESFPELNRLANFIKKHSDINIEISGHTDDVGASQYNLQLSQQRANAVKKYLISKNCNPNQLIAKGYGESKPITDNKT
ncbi:MAG: OmpA family protein, partial [Bacteroidota bacterium]|nr:OmpA family protein [Bacteroidota bacterium]